MHEQDSALDFVFSISTSTLYAFLQSFPGGVVFTDKQGNILFINQGAERIFGYRNSELVGTPFSSLFDMKEDAYHALVDCGKRTSAGYKVQITALAKGNKTLPIEVSRNTINEEGEQLTFFLVEDTRDRQALQDILYHQTITDPLTGMYNRRHFDECITHEFGRASRYQRCFSIIILDLDGFKQANERFGHAYGDDLIIRAAELFKESLREQDMAFRYGGDEFAMILPETSKEGAVDVADRLRNGFARCCNTQGQPVQLSLSIGVASHPEDGRDEKSLLGVADCRMFHSKEHGGNLITAYDTSNESEGRLEKQLASLLSVAQMLEKSQGHSFDSNLNHSEEIRTLACEIGQRLGLTQERLAILEYACMLHDIGTMHIPQSILCKPGKLDDDEWEVVKKHTLIGEEIVGMITLEKCKELDDLRLIVAQHHESVDGSGYPRGLRGDEILIEAKILGVTDAYTAMLSDRAYRPALTKEQAFNELRSLRGVRYDPEVVDVLLAMEAQD